MIITCNECHTKYMLADEKIPEIGIRVRCPKCRFVWRLSPPAQESIFEVATNDFTVDAPVSEMQSGGWSSAEQSRQVMAAGAAAIAEEPAVDTAPGEIEIGEEAPSPEVEEVTDSPELRKKKARAQRLARVFVSDILVYNREKCEKGLTGGDLMTLLGPEIKKSWEAYKEKIGPELVEASNYFRDALNEILADGQKIF
ncbi:MAG: zinc-ribbon domain-containing protein [bacterium]|nr:MAG: zinc-ribbon domain-containing protein [bacterium]